jgi:polar amino acid transport system ATP-binding protein
MAVLEVKNLAKRFGNTFVLNNISFSLEEGEVLAIIGSSGSGKTTLLRCLNSLEKPDAGSIVRQNGISLGLVFQSFNLFPHYTAFENITLAAKLAAKKNKELIEKINREGGRLLEQIGLGAQRDLYPHQLSGGQQQRVAIARALALKPDILCLDEPTSALDPETTGEVLKVIRALAEKKMTMIIVTHEMQFARRSADTILFMDEGLALEYGKPQDVLDNPSCERIKRFLEKYPA